MAGLDSWLEYNEIIMKMFASEEEGYQFYNSYAYKKGFSVRRTYCEWDNGHDEMILRKFVCSCEGFRQMKELQRENKKRKPRPLTRLGCRAKLTIARDQTTGQWYVKDFIDEHNHPMADPQLACMLRSHRRISDAQKADILEMQMSGIWKHQIMDFMDRQYGGYDKVGFTIRDLYNFCHHNKVETVAGGDARTVISYLMESNRRDPDFFFDYKTDGKEQLKGLLWCDSQCVLDYSAFGDVVVFDSTYKTNRYNLPLVPFVGVNHHGSTVLFACGIICHENIESYVWLLRAFSDAMAQKHPPSVITDGDRAMQKAIRLVWPHASHRLCTWHIEQNIVRNVHDDDVKDEIRNFLYGCCSIEEIERKWKEFLDKHKITESWQYPMYEMREIWCAAYHADKCFLGLRSNQRSESMNSRLQFNLDRKMTLLELLKHYDRCLTRLRNNEARLDFEADNSFPVLEPDASIIEKEAAKLFTPRVFAKVQFSIKAASKCKMAEVLDGYDIFKYMVERVDKEDKQYLVECEISVDDNTMKKISCSCLKLQSLGTPCSHIFFVLDYREERVLPDCCVLRRWTSGAKSAFPAIRKTTMFDYSDSLQRYHELRNISHTASFAASHSPEAYERLKHILQEQAAVRVPNGGENRVESYAPVLPQVQAVDVDCAESTNVLDPMYVPGRGAPKKSCCQFQIRRNQRSGVPCVRVTATIGEHAP